MATLRQRKYFPGGGSATSTVTTKPGKFVKPKPTGTITRPGRIGTRNTPNEMRNKLANYSRSKVSQPGNVSGANRIEAVKRRLELLKSKKG